ncbi:MAG TPA: 2Fe-2S iron-sulfur cluster-binding protein [Pyrinomonadaceae bacterium]|jgi:ferredoxin
MSVSQTDFERFLQQHDDAAWAQTLQELLPAIHEVDRTATRIWFAFFPLALQRALAAAPDPAQLAQKLLLQGKYYLKDQIDTSHTFLYGHRFWPEVKLATTAHDAGFKRAANATLAAQIRSVARAVATERRMDEALLTGITAVAFMTVQQVGLPAFRATPGAVALDRKRAKLSPAEVLRQRAKDDSQGVLGFLRTTDKRWTVVWNENNEAARFKMFNSQEVASAAATDERDWWQSDPRCTVGEGPIPVQCRSASCGTCWVGVLGGAEKLSDVSERERKALRLFGYIDTDEPRPIIRLSCQARGAGAVSIVIPPWNGVFGKYVRAQQGAQAQAQGPTVEASA